MWATPDMFLSRCTLTFNIKCQANTSLGNSFLFKVMVMETRALLMLDKCFTTELYSQPA
jgi:hypothetical protein